MLAVADFSYSMAPRGALRMGTMKALALAFDRL